MKLCDDVSSDFLAVFGAEDRGDHWQEDRELYFLCSGYFDFQAVGDAVRLLSGLVHDYFELLVSVFGLGVDFHQDVIELRVVLDVVVLLQYVDGEGLVGVEVLEHHLLDASLLVEGISLGRHLSGFAPDFLQHLGHCFFYLEHRFSLENGLLVVVGGYHLGQYMKVVFVVREDGLDQFCDVAEGRQVELVLVQQLDHIDHLLLHHLLGVDWLLVRLVVEVLEGRLVVLQMTLQLGSHEAVLPPDLALAVELLQGVLEEGLVGFAEVVVVSGQDFFGAGHGVEGVAVVAELEVADSDVGEGEGVGGEVLDGLFVALDCFFVVVHVFVDVAEVVVGVAVPGVDFDGFAVPLDGLVGVVHALVDDGHVVVGRVVLGVGPDALLVVLQGLIVVPHFVVGDASGVVQFVDVVFEVGRHFVGLQVVLDGLLVLLLVVVAQPHVVVIVVGTDGVLLQFRLHLFISVGQFVEDVGHVLVGSLVLLVLLDGAEVPQDGLWVLLLEFVVDADVVVAGSVLRGHLGALLVPADGLVVQLLAAPVDDPDLVDGPSVLGVQLRHPLQLLDLAVVVLLVAGQHEQPHPIRRLDLQDLPRKLHRLRLLDALVLVNVGDALQRTHPVGPHLSHLVVQLNRLLVDGLAAQQVGQPHLQLVTARVQTDHVPVPLYPRLHHLLVAFETEQTQGEDVVGGAEVGLVLDALPVPLGNEPLVVANSEFVVAEPVDGDVDSSAFLQVLLEQGYCFLKLVFEEKGVRFRDQWMSHDF